MESPKVLNLFRIDFSSPPPLMVVRNLKNLRTLCLTRCSVKDTSSIIGEGLKNLEYLSFRESDIEELPEEIGILTQLKLLDLTGCKKLKVIPRDVIGGLSQLEELYMKDSFADWELERQDEERKNASLGELKRLSHLISLDIEIPDANLLPEDLVFENLSRFKIRIGAGFWSWEQFSLSKILSLKLNVNTALKDGIKELLKKVEHLQLSEMEGLKSVVYDLDREGFQNLRRLQVHKCGEVEYIFNASEWFLPVTFPKLEKLDLNGLPKLKEICHGQLPAMFFSELQELRLSDLPGLINLWNDPAHHLYFHNLTVVTVYKCGGLKNLFSHSVAKGLSKLVKLEVGRCKMMEEIVGNDKEAAPAVAAVDDIMFPKLRSLMLGNLPKLKNFCLKMEGDLDTSTEEALFGKKVVFPALQTLHISSIGDEVGIQHSQLLAETVGFRNLRSIYIYNCNSLKNLFSHSVAKGLSKLVKLEVIGCETMEEIVGNDKEAASAVAAVDDIIMFPKLRSLTLIGLPELKNFCLKMEGDVDTSTEEALFGKKVVFPALETLHIGYIGLKTEIQHSQLLAETLGFRNLRSINIWDCNSVKSLFSPSMASSLVQLKEVKIYSCKMMESIIAEERKAEEYCQEISVFPERRRSLKLLNLPKIISFMKTFTSIFSVQQNLSIKDEIVKEALQEGNPHDQKVCLPTLEVLKIKDLDNLKDIWHPQILAKSFCQLRVLEVESCHKISNVIPSNLLKHLTNLMEVSVKKCDLVQIIFEVEPLAVKDRRGTGTLSQLRKLELSGLPKLFTFEHPLLQNLELDDEKIEEKPDESKSCIPIRPLFDELVAFTNLVELRIINIENLQEIFHTQLAYESFSQLRFLEVRECHKLSRVAPSNLLPRLKNLNALIVEESNSMETIFELEGEGHAAFSLFQLRNVKLRHLPNLMMFCSGNCDFELPLLEDLVLEKCPKMQKFSSGLNSTPNLGSFYVEEYKYISRRISVKGISVKGDLNSSIHHLFQEKAKLKSDKSSGKEVEEGAEGENASAHQGIQRVISEIQEEA